MTEGDEAPRPPGVAVLALAIFMVAFGTNVSTPFLVLYRDRLDLGPSATQAIFSVYVVGIIAALLVSGPLSDRIGRRAVVLPCLGMSAAASLLMIFGRDSYVVLLVARVLLGVVSGAVLSVGSAWLLELYGTGRQTTAALTATIASYAGFGLGPVMSAVFHRLDIAPLVAPFIAHAGLVLLALVAALGIPDPRPATPGGLWLVRLRVPPRAKRIFWTAIVPATIWTFAFPSTGFSLFPVLLSDFAKGNTVLVGALSGTITAFGGLVARPLIGRLGASRSLVTGVVIGVTGYLLGSIAFATETWYPILPAAACLGAASGTLSASALTLLGGFADDASRGSLTSTMYLIAYPGMMMPIIVTSIASVSSISIALVVITSLAVLAAGIVGRSVAGLGVANPSAREA